jgi:hypothetical protein
MSGRWCLADPQGRWHQPGTAPGRPGLGWAEFLRSQAQGILDFFTADLLNGTKVYVLAVIEHGTRRIRILGATGHPVQSWVVQQARNILMDLDDAGMSVKFVLHNRDASFTAAVDAVFQAAGPRGVRSAIQALRMNQVADPVGEDEAVPALAEGGGDVGDDLLVAVVAGDEVLVDDGHPARRGRAGVSGVAVGGRVDAQHRRGPPARGAAGQHVRAAGGLPGEGDGVADRPEYVASVVLRLLRTGEDTFDIPHGPEQPGIARIPD